MTLRIRMRLGGGLCIGLVAVAVARAEMTEAQKQECIRRFHIDPKASDSRGWHEPAAGSCKVVIRSDGHRFPDPACTPGALNPTIGEEVLRNRDFATECIRDMATSEEEKKTVFTWYGIREDPTCELDHLVSLELGGADTLDNIWPQCGPAGAAGLARDFKQKDSVELFLGEQVKLGASNGGISQQDAKLRITRDWAALIDEAKKPRPK
jgi:hypothetical protein